MTPTDVLVRPATPHDAVAVTDVHLASRKAAAMPPSIHEDHEAYSWMAGRLADVDVWVAEVDGEIVGYLRLTPTWLDDLYVVPSHARLGIGTLLLDVAKSLRPDGFSLWVFEMSAPARAFYAHHGLVEREHTDGSDNEERVPDLRLSWG